jgi:DeoR family transcriptional regulator, glycerol-3-phosphate regulon repressor
MSTTNNLLTRLVNGSSRLENENRERNPSALQRKKAILALVRSQGFLSIEALAKHFSVTSQTIRRDVNELAKTGFLRRYHGGAGLPSSVENLGYQARKMFCSSGKVRIARTLAKHIPDEASLFIDIGTTAEEVARALCDHKALRIITNNLNAACILSEKNDFEVFVTGGIVRSGDRGITGEAAIDFINQFNVDFAIISISGIDAEGALLDFDYSEVRVGQAIIARARKILLAADHTKFGRDAMVRICNISDVDALFTDQTPPKQMMELLSASHVELHIADAEIGTD